jgi:hypothetical protein
MRHNTPYTPAPVGDVAFLQPLNPLLEQRLEVRMLEKKINHIKVQSAVYVLPGSLVQIHIESGFFMGEIQYCLANASAFDAVIDLQNSFFFEAPVDNTHQPSGSA